MEDIISFGEWVRRRRQALDLTRVALATLVSCSPVTIKKIERDERRPSLQIAELLAEHLQLPESTRQQFMQMSRGQYVEAMPSPLDASPQPAFVRPPDRRGRPFGNLPEQTTSFVGREEELTEIGRLLRDEAGCRMLTLVGLGGIGKTRLAIQAAGQLLDIFPDGIFFVSLAPISSASLLVSTVTDALGIRFHSGADLADQLLRHLRKKRLLLLMDNFEYLLAPEANDKAMAAVDSLTEILGAAPQVKILVTSRERLNVQEEWVFDVGGLTIPHELADEAPETYSSLALFIERARQVKRDFTLVAGDLPHVVRICRLAGGMPLGLELAAGWIRLLAPQDIAREIESSLGFLESSMRNVPERHRSLRAVFRHSWEMLTDEEQTLFRKLSVFHGGFLRQVAPAVADATLGTLSGLVDKSLLRRRQNGRYEIHELLRQYAAEQLAEITGAFPEARNRHSLYYCRFLHKREMDLKSGKVLEALEEIGNDVENIRLAWSWAVEQEQIAYLEKAAESLGWFYYWPGRHLEGVAAFQLATEQLEAMVAHTPPGSGRVLRLWSRLLAWQSRFTSQLERYVEARELCQKALDILQRPELNGQDTRAERAFVLEVLGFTTLWIATDPSSAIVFCEQSLAHYRDLDDRWGVAYVLAHLGELAVYNGEYGAAEELLREAWELSDALGHLLQAVWPLLDLSRAFSFQGRFEEGQVWLHQALTLCQTNDYKPGLYVAQNNSGMIAIQRGQFAQAQALLTDIATLGSDLESSMLVGWQSLLQSWALLHLGRYQEAETRARGTTSIYEQKNRTWEIAFGRFLLACLKLTQGESREVQQWLSESNRLFQDVKDSYHSIMVSATQSYIAGQAGDGTEARQGLLQTLRLGLGMRAYLPVLKAIPAAAVLMAYEGKQERAVELYALAESHPYVGNSRWYADVVARQIEAVVNALPQDVAVAAQERGRAGDLWVTAETLLTELQAPKAK